MMDAPERDSRPDRIAREAAILIDTGRTRHVGQAIRMAAAALGLTDAPLPGPGTVRKHVQAMTMQQLGDAGYAQAQRRIWEIAENVMTVIEQSLPDVQTCLMGRSATGHFDADVTLHVRLYTNRPVGDIAEVLVLHEYVEPAFDTVQTRFGMLNRVRFDEEGVPVVLTRCPLNMNIARDLDAFSGRAIAHLSLEQVRQHMA